MEIISNHHRPAGGPSPAKGKIVVKYGPTPENLNAIHGKAKDKNDGVYSFRGIVYRVSGGEFTHFAHNGRVLGRAGNFNVGIGFYSGYPDDAKKLLKAIG